MGVHMDVCVYGVRVFSIVQSEGNESTIDDDDDDVDDGWSM